jgi:single-stranded-DNA-specific exonuclease
MATRWRLHPHEPEKIAALSREAQVPPLIAHLLLNRGVGDSARARSFLDRKLADLHDPANLPGATEAAERIVAAARAGRTIAIYGDYDVDGVCGTSLLWACLQLAGAKNVLYYIPKRVEEGYGVNGQALEWLAKEAKADLVVTVDCGISAVKEARLAKELGLELIITDHHTIGPDLPEAAVLVHPRLPGGSYPFPHLCGAGVAFKVAWQVCKSFGDGKKASPHLRDFLVESLALVSLATIADVVPMVDENRTLVSHGLEGLLRSPTAGQRALLEVCGLLSKPSLNSGHVGFGIAPRINAAGRLESAMQAVQLLTTDDPDAARSLAARLDQCNQQRQEVERRIVGEAHEMVHALGSLDDRGAIVVGNRGWHPGVIGIVASRLVDAYHRPTIVVALGDEVGQGSGRSVPEFNLYDAISACSEGLLGFGGHAAAAGIKIPPGRFEDFAKRFDEHCHATLTQEQRLKRLSIDAEIPLSMLDTRLVDWIDSLEPHGPGNPKPLFLSHDVVVAGPPRFVGAEQKHVQFRFRQDGGPALKGIAWNMHERAKPLQEGVRCSLVFQPAVNVWNNQRSVQLEVKDFRVHGEG